MLKNYGVLILGLPLLLLPAASSLSQSQGKAEEAKVEDKASSKAENSKAKDKTPADSKSEVPEIFIPSEKISEDLSVAFPVDI